MAITGEVFECSSCKLRLCINALGLFSPRAKPVLVHCPCCGKMLGTTLGTAFKVLSLQSLKHRIVLVPESFLSEITDTEKDFFEKILKKKPI